MADINPETNFNIDPGSTHDSKLIISINMSYLYLVSFRWNLVDIQFLKKLMKILI